MMEDIYLNFIYNIGLITPTQSTILSKKFIHNARSISTGFEQSSGTSRSYEIQWSGADALIEPTDVVERIADHSFTLSFYYSTEFSDDIAHKIISSDRHDLIKRLRDTNYYVGISSTEPTKNIGLFRRELVRETLERSDEVLWIYRQEWSCTISEEEI